MKNKDLLMKLKLNKSVLNVKSVKKKKPKREPVKKQRKRCVKRKNARKKRNLIKYKN